METETRYKPLNHLYNVIEAFKATIANSDEFPLEFSLAHKNHLAETLATQLKLPIDYVAKILTIIYLSDHV